MLTNDGIASSSTSRSPSRAGPGTPLRKVLTGDESAQFRHRPPANRFSTNAGDGLSPDLRRRSSTFSEYSLNEARKSFQESADDVLLPTPLGAIDSRAEHSNWDSAPLAFALLPAVGGLLFKNGSSIITDIMLLGLAAVFLNWSVRLPWNWYHSAQSIRKRGEYDSDTVVEMDSDEDVALSVSQGSLDKVPEEEAGKPTKKEPKPMQQLPAHEDASNELYMHETLALVSCFVFPVFGAYLLHTIRSQLTRPSEGLVSNYNLTIFLLASEIRPMGHLIKLIQSRTLHLQRIVNSNPYDKVRGEDTKQIQDLVCRIDELEARALASPVNDGKVVEQQLTAKQTSLLTTEVRRTLQPELDALNRAVRRYEKRATMQAIQTESRLQELESRLNDAISLAAAAANHGQRRHSFSAILLEWSASTIVLPVQAFGTLARLPFKVILSVVNYGKMTFLGHKPRPVEKSKKNISGKYPLNRMGSDRSQGRTVRRTSNGPT
ncbi:hypothetical protein PVAG01_05275 [Phlyctema vagabunda]|uniref:Uncharacterized protein n=1 Tax=Phlyctema vagabunda TaxID=108571 RepID=A0ABR4PJM5_9HELO